MFAKTAPAYASEVCLLALRVTDGVCEPLLDNPATCICRRLGYAMQTVAMMVHKQDREVY
jgi:hypothetical protein